MTAAPGAAALLADRLAVRYGRRTWALNGVSVTVGHGRTTALIGPNAAGKSTLIRTWLGFERPSRGQALVAGFDPIRQRVDALRLIGYVPQRIRLYRDLTVADHIALAARLRSRFDRTLAGKWLGDMGVPLTSRASSLSGGQSTQVALALALGTRAKILLLDEPLAELDPLARREFMSVLRVATESGTTVLLSSHVVPDIERVCDWVIVLGNGSLLLDTAIGDARGRHRVVPAAEAARSPDAVVAALPDGDGWLVREAGPGGEVAGSRGATLEQIVLAYLARGRALQQGLVSPTPQKTS